MCQLSIPTNKIQTNSKENLFWKDQLGTSVSISLARTLTQAFPDAREAETHGSFGWSHRPSKQKERKREGGTGLGSQPFLLSSLPVCCIKDPRQMHGLLPGPFLTTLRGCPTSHHCPQGPCPSPSTSLFLF